MIIGILIGFCFAWTLQWWRYRKFHTNLLKDIQELERLFKNPTTNATKKYK